VRARTAAACAAAILTACARAPAKQSFAEAGLLAPAEPEGPPAPPVKVAAPRARPVEAPAGPPIDAALLPFAVEARSRRGRTPAGRGFPAEAREAWSAVAAELERYLQRPMPQTPLLELVRARVTMESELVFDERRYGPAPAELADRLSPLLDRLAARAQAARAVGGRLFARQAPPALRWPLEGAGISSAFGMRLHPVDGQRRMHWGIDLAASQGRVVGAAGPGYVVHAGWMNGYGWLVERATHSAYETPLPVTATILDRSDRCNALQRLGADRLKSEPDGTVLALLPRYEGYSASAVEIARCGAAFREIAGNRSIILVSAIGRHDDPHPAGVRLLFQQPILTQPGRQRRAYLVPVPALGATLNALASDGLAIEHVFDY